MEHQGQHCSWFFSTWCGVLVEIFWRFVSDIKFNVSVPYINAFWWLGTFYFVFNVLSGVCGEICSNKLLIFCESIGEIFDTLLPKPGFAATCFRDGKSNSVLHLYPAGAGRNLWLQENEKKPQGSVEYVFFSLLRLSPIW